MEENKYLGGYVTSPKPFIGKKREINEDGIFSQKIFGPVNSYQCKCGKLKYRSLYAGQTCQSCFVMCTDKSIRRSTFGKIKTIFPIIKLNKKEKILKILNARRSSLLLPSRADFIASSTRYIAIKLDKTKIRLTKILGVNEGYLTIPFKITGIFSLYLVLKFINDSFKIPVVKEIFDNNYITNNIKVLPPDIRLEMYDKDKDRFRTPEINKIYNGLLFLNNKNIYIGANLEQDIFDWSEKLRYHLKSNLIHDYIAESAVIEYDYIAAKYQYYSDEIYRYIYDKLSGKEGMIRSSILGKTIEFSARTVIRSDPSLKPYEIKVSKNILKVLWLPLFHHWLTSEKGFEYDYTYEEIVLKNSNEEIKNQLFDEFLEWFYRPNYELDLS